MKKNFLKKLIPIMDYEDDWDDEDYEEDEDELFSYGDYGELAGSL